VRPDTIRGWHARKRRASAIFNGPASRSLPPRPRPSRPAASSMLLRRRITFRPIIASYRTQGEIIIRPFSVANDGGWMVALKDGAAPRGEGEYEVFSSCWPRPTPTPTPTLTSEGRGKSIPAPLLPPPDWTIASSSSYARKGAILEIG